MILRRVIIGNNASTLYKRYLIFLMAPVILSACAITTSEKDGALLEGVYYSSTKEFSVAVPTGTIVRDGKHPLGGFVSITKLPDPILERGIAYYRVAQSSSGLTSEEANGIIRTSHNDWLKNYALRGLENISHEEWVEIDGKPAYFAVIEGAKSGLLVKPGAYYGVISLARGNYSFVVYDMIDAPYELSGSRDSPQTINIKNSKTRFDSIKEYLDSVRFGNNSAIKSPM
jgi:hypothetical protein